jgi:hypothetical protein
MKLRNLTNEMINAVFDDENANPSSVIIGMYKLAYPDWDDIESVVDFPRVSRKTCDYIQQRCIELDREQCSNCMNGGFWVNYGFGVGDVPDWKVKLAPVIYKNKLTLVKVA